MRPAKKSFLAGCLGRNCGYITLFLILVLFLQAGLYAGHLNLHQSETSLYGDEGQRLASSAKASADAKLNSLNEVGTHPVETLMEEAEVEFRKKLDSQSKTLKAAVAEYKRRYNLDPPKGFDQWWEFAQKYSVVMVDEYDGLMSDLAPFRYLPGEEFRRRIQQVGMLPSIDLVRLRDGVPKTIKLQPGFKDSEVSARANGYRSMLGKFAKDLPDMDFPINAKAEGRVLVPWEHQKYPNMTLQNSTEGVEAMLGGPFQPDWGSSGGNIWEAWRRTCDPSSTARRLFSSLRNALIDQGQSYLSAATHTPGDDFAFAKTTSSQLDFCDKPYAHYSQGHFFSDWRSIPALYPVFSPARAKGFMDIRIPSHYYYGSTKRYTYGWDPVNLELKKVDPMEVAWEKKIDKIFWRGATTGGGNHPPGFAPQYQRHRFLRMSSDKSDNIRTVTYPDPPNVTTNAHYSIAPVPIGKINEEIMDAAFVKAVSPESFPGGLPALEKYHRFAEAVPLGRHWAYKYLIDFDGMSYSGRFLAFLASDSVPIKSTVYDEFFTDWIQPWVHYIPLSETYKEIYNIYAYFSGPTQSILEAANSTTLDLPKEEWKHLEGDRRARRIARAGKEWKQTIGRTLDMEAYVYRLSLEWARLYADDRESMNFVI